ncbi:MAG: glycerophosphodiester phosphodiesterase family protein [Crocinitomicaceae bacterium]
MKKWLQLSGLMMVLFACKKEFPELTTEVYGHAGESLFTSRSKYPPNTLESIDYAINELGADGVEVDVQMTADNVLVLFHDLELDEQTKTAGCINDKLYNEVKEIKVYNSDIKIPLLKEALDLALNVNRKIMLDVKHYNSCEEKKMDYTDFNAALQLLFSDIPDAKKELITVNCRDIQLLTAVTDTIVKKSFESDDYDTAIPLILSHKLEMLCTKLNSITTEARDQLKSNGIDLALYNLRTRSEVNRALEFAPEFVISDNIKYTLKALNG